MAKKPKKSAPEKQSKKSAPEKQPRPRRKRKKKLKPIFELRRDEDIPAGFDVPVGMQSQEEAYASIQARLEDAKLRLPEGYSGKVLMHAYIDGSVDGELYVIVPEDEHQGGTAWAVNQAIGTDDLGKRFWLSTGARFTHKKGEEWYRKHGGLNQTETNYQRAISANFPEVNLLLRKKLLTGLKAKYGREAHSVFLRLHWNPENKQPKRDPEGS